MYGWTSYTSISVPNVKNLLFAYDATNWLIRFTNGMDGASKRGAD